MKAADLMSQAGWVQEHGKRIVSLGQPGTTAALLRDARTSTEIESAIGTQAARESEDRDQRQRKSTVEPWHFAADCCVLVELAQASMA
jgi:hypothetical protein